MSAGWYGNHRQGRGIAARSRRDRNAARRVRQVLRASLGFTLMAVTVILWLK